MKYAFQENQSQAKSVPSNRYRHYFTLKLQQASPTERVQDQYLGRKLSNHMSNQVNTSKLYLVCFLVQPLTKSGCIAAYKFAVDLIKCQAIMSSRGAEEVEKPWHRILKISLLPGETTYQISIRYPIGCLLLDL